MLRLSCLVAALAWLLCLTASAQTDVSARLKPVAEAAHVRGDFDGVIVVAQHGAVIWQYAAGEADHVTHRPITVNSTFRLASLTKQVTAVLVMRQVEKGTLRLDQPAAELLPGLSATTGRATVQQLLQHISGLPNPTNGPDDVVPPFYLAGPVGRDYLQTTAKGFCSGKPVRAPDEKFEYNNCDYIVLGAILEQVEHKPFAEIVRADVTQPLGLKSWGVFMGRGETPVAVRGYGGDGKPELPQNVATYGAAGALYGNALDVTRWDSALLQHRLLSAASTATMFHGENNLGGEALGSWSYDLPGTKPAVHLIERQGDIGGTRVLNLLLPGEDASIVILANTERADLFNTYSQKGLGYELVKAFTGR